MRLSDSNLLDAGNVPVTEFCLLKIAEVVFIVDDLVDSATRIGKLDGLRFVQFDGVFKLVRESELGAASCYSAFPVRPVAVEVFGCSAASRSIGYDYRCRRPRL